jgi:hypothetical protein
VALRWNGYIIFESPYFQSKISKQAGCQVDYLIQTRFKNLYVCEVKCSHKPISVDVIREMEKKIAAFKIPKGFSCLPVLIHVNGVTRAVKESIFFTRIIDFSENLTTSF